MNVSCIRSDHDLSLTLTKVILLCTLGLLYWLLYKVLTIYPKKHTHTQVLLTLHMRIFRCVTLVVKIDLSLLQIKQLDYRKYCSHGKKKLQLLVGTSVFASEKGKRMSEFALCLENINYSYKDKLALFMRNHLYGWNMFLDNQTVWLNLPVVLQFPS